MTRRRYVDIILCHFPWHRRDEEYISDVQQVLDHFSTIDSWVDFYSLRKPPAGRVAGTIVVRLSSVLVIFWSNLSLVPPLLMHVRKWPAAMLAIKRSAGVAPEVESWGMYTTFISSKKANKAEPTRAAISGFETQRRRHQKSKTGVPKRTCVRQKLSTKEKSLLKIPSFILYLTPNRSSMHPCVRTNLTWILTDFTDSVLNYGFCLKVRNTK